MNQQINNVIDYLKTLNIKGCITGSCLLEYFEGQDIDVFIYDERNTLKVLYTLMHNPMFQVCEELEQWKLDMFLEREERYKMDLLTIKFTYNNCVKLNIIWKKKCNNIYSVLAGFDMNIIAKGYDIFTGKTLDLTENSTISKIASWNTYNTDFYSWDLWSGKRLLRQLERCIKYHQRGYNTDAVTLKYLEIIKDTESAESFFKKKEFNDSLEETKTLLKGVRSIVEKWLETHEITNDELNLLREKINEL